MLAAVYRNRGRFRERDRAAVYLSRVDSKLAALRHALRQIRAAGTLSANASELVAWARDTALPLAVRRELVLAVAFGWAYNDHETRSGAAESRKKALAELDRGELPPEFESVVRTGTAAFGSNMLKRLAIALRYKMT